MAFSEPSLNRAKRTSFVSTGSIGAGFTAGSGGRSASTAALNTVMSLKLAFPVSGKTGLSTVLFSSSVMSWTVVLKTVNCMCEF